MKEETLGQQRVRLNFNSLGEITPKADETILDLKLTIARLIDSLEKFRELDPRLCDFAQKDLESGCSWAVKLLTTKIN